jgi:hypothetical protein
MVVVLVVDFLVITYKQFRLLCFQLHRISLQRVHRSRSR